MQKAKGKRQNLAHVWLRTLHALLPISRSGRPAARSALSVCFILALLLLAPIPAQAQPRDPTEGVAFDQKLDALVPLDLSFVDEQGQAVRLGDYFAGGKPVVLVLSYYECPMLCSLVREGLVQSLQQVPLDVGRDFSVVNVSIDPLETPMMAGNVKNAVISRYNRPGTDAGWHFLTGTQDSIKQLADAIGFQYVYDETIDQYAHAAGITVLTPTGHVSRYFYGIEYNASDLRLGLVESSSNQIGTAVDQLLLLCYHYDPVTGRYTGLVMTILRTLGALTVVGIIALIVILSRGSGRPGQPHGPAQAFG